jgi:hypothetical protein
MAIPKRTARTHNNHPATKDALSEIDATVVDIPLKQQHA